MPPDEPAPHFDDECDDHEKLPREFAYTFEYREVKGGQKIVMLDASGKTVGDPLTDNAYADDGYRFHDVLHLAPARGARLVARLS